MTAMLPAGTRLYAIGDVHGSLHLLKQLLQKIEAECAAAKTPSRKIFLGDYIDRGLHSRETIDFLLSWSEQERVPPIFLLGNHEQIMREIILNHDTEKFISWLRFGGRETMRSYGIVASSSSEDTLALMQSFIAKVPESHVDFLRQLRTSAHFGDYFFCHAGARPGVSLAAQSEQDLVWIRDPFLDYTGSFGKTVVHGHSISKEAEFRPNRIGIDTGAYSTGRLTALGLDGDRTWLVQTT